MRRLPIRRDLQKIELVPKRPPFFTELARISLVGKKDEVVLVFEQEWNQGSKVWTSDNMIRGFLESCG